MFGGYRESIDAIMRDKKAEKEKADAAARKDTSGT
jgi:hypothetical protein